MSLVKAGLVKPMLRPMLKPLVAGGGGNFDDFILTVRTTAANETFTLPFQPSAPVNPWLYDVDWGDGTSDLGLTTSNDPALVHEYAVAGDYDITISGSANCVRFASNTTSQSQLIDVKQWGRTGWTNCYAAFWFCSNCVFTAGPECDTSEVTNMAATFRDCTVGNPDVSQFDMRKVTTTVSMLDSLPIANPDVSNWDTGSLEFIARMFQYSTAANPDVSNWDISNVTDATNFLVLTAFSDENFDKALLSWSAQPHQNNVTVHFGSAQYTEVAAYNSLVADGWIITSGGLKQ